MAEDVQKNVLLIEGDHVLRERYRTRLAQAGFAVYEASTSVEAMEATRGRTPDVVLLDLVLSPQNGFALLEEMQNEAAFRSVPVIVLSDLGSTADRDRAASLGAVDHIVKKKDSPSDAVMMIRRALGGSTEREPLAASSAPRKDNSSEASQGPDILLGEDAPETESQSQ